MLTRPHPTCAEVRRELTSFALREMSAADAALVREHLDGCAPCAREGADVFRLVGGLRSTARRGAAAWPRRAACAAGIAALLAVIWFSPDSDAPAVAAQAGPARASTVAGLLAAQAEDGAWREDPRDGASLFTVGLSGLATVGCLRAAPADPAAEDAARRGCDFLVAALAANELLPAGVSPDLSLRAQAAAAWALGTAAVRWPDRYRRDAIVAIRRLGRLRDGWMDESSGDVTAALVSEAYRAASAIGIAGSPSAHVPAAELVAVRFAGPAAPVTRLAEQVLADASAF
jgi:Putative zinc-finger